MSNNYMEFAGLLQSTCNFCLGNIMKPSQALSLYLHIPFCRTMCSYCAFNTYTDLDNLIPDFVNALIQELRYVAERNPGYEVRTIYFGGGTPSLLTYEQYSNLFDALHKGFRLQADAEITLEANPDDLTSDYAQALRTVGFNRVSIGMQTAGATELDLFNRRHDMATVHRAVQAALGAGFDNLSLDLIFGSPIQTLADWQTTLQEAISLAPKHLSAYNMILKPGTDLTKMVDAGQLPTPDDDLAADMYDLATDMLAEAGYQQYEITNWAQPGYESQHNLQYWRYLPYLGLGPGAHGFAEGVRTIAKRTPQRYIEALQTRQDEPRAFPETPATAQAIHLDTATEMTETIMMSLRMTREGVQRPTFRERFGVDLLELHREAIDRFVSYGLLHVDDTVIRLTKQGRFVSNAIIRELI